MSSPSQFGWSDLNSDVDMLRLPSYGKLGTPVRDADVP